VPLALLPPLSRALPSAPATPKAAFDAQAAICLGPAASAPRCKLGLVAVDLVPGASSAAAYLAGGQWCLIHLLGRAPGAALAAAQGASPLGPPVQFLVTGACPKSTWWRALLHQLHAAGEAVAVSVTPGDRDPAMAWNGQLRPLGPASALLLLGPADDTPRCPHVPGTDTDAAKSCCDCGAAMAANQSFAEPLFFPAPATATPAGSSDSLMLQGMVACLPPGPLPWTGGFLSGSMSTVLQKMDAAVRSPEEMLAALPAGVVDLHHDASFAMAAELQLDSSPHVDAPSPSKADAKRRSVLNRLASQLQAAQQLRSEEPSLADDDMAAESAKEAFLTAVSELHAAGLRPRAAAVEQVLRAALISVKDLHPGASRAPRSLAANIRVLLVQLVLRLSAMAASAECLRAQTQPPVEDPRKRARLARAASSMQTTDMSSEDDSDDEDDGLPSEQAVALGCAGDFAPEIIRLLRSNAMLLNLHRSDGLNTLRRLLARQFSRPLPRTSRDIAGDTTLLHQAPSPPPLASIPPPAATLAATAIPSGTDARKGPKTLPRVPSFDAGTVSKKRNLQPSGRAIVVPKPIKSTKKNAAVDAGAATRAGGARALSLASLLTPSCRCRTWRQCRSCARYPS
jgi:hypothetical protein